MSDNPYSMPKNYMKWLPGDGTLHDIRVDHGVDRQRYQYGLNSLVNPYTYAQVEFLLRYIEEMQE